MAKIIVDTDEIFSVKEAADKIGISEATAWRWIKANKLIVLYISDRTVVPASEIERLKKGVEN